MSVLINVLEKDSIIGVAGNRSTGKTHTILSELIHLKREIPTFPIYAYGVNKSLHNVLEKNGINILLNKNDILDLKIENALIFVDEMAMFFDTKTRSKQLGKLERFFDRIEHKNCKFIIGTAREGYFNKFMCSRVSTFIVKEIEYDALVNATWLKEAVKGIESLSDYRLELPKDSYYVVTNKDRLTEKHHSTYFPELDSKKDNINLIAKYKSEKKSENICEKQGEQKRDLQKKGFIKVVE
jgi:hypothetical protein